MHYFSSPFLSLSPSFHLSRRSNSDSDASNPSSTTTSPPSSPTSTHTSIRNISPHALFNFSLDHCKSRTVRDEQPDHSVGRTHSPGNSEDNHTHRCPASDTIPQGQNVLPSTVLRGRSSMMVVRRRLSKIDMALSEERSRCDGDSIERQGLGLMEPRPVDQRVGEVQPNFVMGGILEVMEGRA
ncbi:hypothetical protein N7475_000479 [Penicillium sp. IBT 31633x]|nr:hypothetical protein N7475_000479 [Penicillium sp. IBT 31633x]